MLVAATLLTLFVVLARQNPFVGLVTLWAFYGIILKQRELYPGSYPEIVTTSWVGMALVAAAVLVMLYRNSQAGKKAAATV